ncbi:hypothetical protein CEXT_381571 [Caerostris extrusa]|uniref:Ig-like domain-containing protein n=1 Tax=Caerostris extrusa TaxID=172846 RepID=A0AAV4WDF9_CAEEX|nr:hypothetical protein CEXT_381571 [Caerostris extrusa]
MFSVADRPECSVRKDYDDQRNVVLICRSVAHPAVTNFSWFRDNASPQRPPRQRPARERPGAQGRRQPGPVLLRQQQRPGALGPLQAAAHLPARYTHSHFSRMSCLPCSLNMFISIISSSQFLSFVY